MPLHWIVVALAALLACTTSTRAEVERILDFVSDVQLEPDSSLLVTQTIRFSWDRPRHGINRDFPTDYRGRWGSRSTTGFDLKEVWLDGQTVPVELLRWRNGVRVQIGDPERLVPAGVHTYTISYVRRWQVSFRPQEDVLNWNVTGNGWQWSIDRAEYHLHAPVGLAWHSVHLVTGPQGRHGDDARIVSEAPGDLVVATTRPLSVEAGLTVAAAFPKGVIAQPTWLKEAAHWVMDNLGVSASFLGLVAMSGYVGWLFLYRAPRPPGVVIPQFAPPSGFSPAMVGYLEDKTMNDRDFSAAIVGLAVMRRLKLIHQGSTYRLVRQDAGEPVSDLEARVEDSLFSNDNELSISPQNRHLILRARLDLLAGLRRLTDPALLRKEPYNALLSSLIAVVMVVVMSLGLVIEFGEVAKQVGIAMVAMAIAIAAPVVAIFSPKITERGWWVLVMISGVLFLAGCVYVVQASGTPFVLLTIGFASGTLALAGASFSPVLTPEGWKRRYEIEGLKLFLGVAEANRLRMLNPPDFTPALYERLLPYAIALGVDMVWSRRFADALLASSTHYEPDWYEGDHPFGGGLSDASELSSDLGGGLATAISAASTPPSSSGAAADSSDGGSDSGGSGEGGGGGGGSGW